MYIHLGNDVAIPAADIVGIFDLDHASTAKATREFLRQAEEEGMVLPIGEDLPLSMVIACPPGSWQRVYLSPFMPSTLKMRIFGRT